MISFQISFLVLGALSPAAALPECAKSPSMLQVSRSLGVDAQAVINEHFKHVPHGGRYVSSNFVSQDEHSRRNILKSAAFECSKIDFSKVRGAGSDNDMVNELLDRLQISKYCGDFEGKGGLAPSDPTCKAIWAGMKAHIELQNLGADPVFKNFMVVNWYANLKGHYPSWGDSDAVTVDYADGRVVNVTIHEKNAVSPYAFCDIVETVLRQNADQGGSGICAPTSTLTALSTIDPAYAIKRGLELYWTGKFDETPEDVACPYIYDEMSPGVVPYLQLQPGTEGSAGMPEMLDCTGSGADCGGDAMPSTNAGFVAMWAFFLGSARDHLTYDSCNESSRHYFVKYPGMKPQHLAQLHESWGLQEMSHLISYSLLPGYRYAMRWFSANDTENEEIMEELCSSDGAVLVIASVGVADAIFSGHVSPSNPLSMENSELVCDQMVNYDHAVYMTGCHGPKKDVVSIWTWTGRLYFTRDYLLHFAKNCPETQAGQNAGSIVAVSFPLVSPS